MTSHPSGPSSPLSPPRRLLILKLGAIGDVMMAIPAAAAMHASGYTIDWVASETVAPLLQLYPWIQVIPVNEAQLLRAGRVAGIRSVLALWRSLLGRSSALGPYNVCAVLYYDRRYRRLTLPLRSERHILLSTHDRATRLLPGRHHTDEYARILTGAEDGEHPTQLAPIPPPSLPANPLPYPAAGSPRVVLVPAGARNLLRDDALRRWPVESYVALAELLLARGCEVVLAGGPEDRWATPHFAPLAAAGTLTDRIGQLSLLETLGLLHSAAVTVTHDTGPLHLAGIASTAIVALFGPTDPRGRLPQRSGTVALWGGEGFACRPCYDGRDYAPCANNGCMQQITPAMVAAEVETLLRARREGRFPLPRILAPPHTPVQIAVQKPCA